MLRWTHPSCAIVKMTTCPKLTASLRRAATVLACCISCSSSVGPSGRLGSVGIPRSPPSVRQGAIWSQWSRSSSQTCAVGKSVSSQSSTMRLSRASCHTSRWETLVSGVRSGLAAITACPSCSKYSLPFLGVVLATWSYDRLASGGQRSCCGRLVSSLLWLLLLLRGLPSNSSWSFGSSLGWPTTGSAGWPPHILAAAVPRNCSQGPKSRPTAQWRARTRPAGAARPLALP
mmetsp:Transcript_91152/g.276784  ORF Transcript_91152/g.276784 Transcript_91152/m.276784 type:complete len:231 (-) Transcript_91152:2-694(-)